MRSRAAPCGVAFATVPLPTGTVTFCMTDIEGSTRLLAELGDRYGPLLEAHRDIVRAELARYSGVEVETEGDSFFCVFSRVAQALDMAIAVQRCLAAHPWPEDGRCVSGSACTPVRGS
jgi:class 3 adenylate cyclase